jgi:nucleotide-binding universal stress UspA family protein
MKKIENILHPTDFSANSTKALTYAVSLAEKYDSRLHILHVALAPDMVITYSMLQNTSEELKLRHRDSLDANLMKLPSADMGSPKSVVHEVVEGIPLLEILRYMDKKSIDMVVMGTHGHSGLKHLVMGSIAENMVRKSTVPVLTVK